MFSELMTRLSSRLRDPIIVDRWIDVASAFSWLFLGVFGLFYSLAHFSTLSQLTTEAYTTWWGLSIGVTGLLAGAAAFSTLFTSRVRLRIFKKQTELILISLLGGLISVYPILKVADLLIPPFQITEISALAVSLYFMILPTWRIFHLTKRIRALRVALKDLAK